ncbi:MAG: type III-A CRISPR-associated protein Cas10/Csm1 [Desulfobacula sp.]|nr:type III-A CRISPR-associated protein Cas10/Csm1 [Desulfobacula sp.]
MDPTTLKVSMAAFFHDMGKFAGKKELEIPSQNINPDDKPLYLKSYKGTYSHYHALYTAQFIEKFSDWLPQELNSPDWGEKDIFTNLAAMHHKPESPIQHIITEADCLSSGWDRDKFNKEYNLAPSVKNYKRTRLLPILEQLSPVEDQQSDSISDYKYRYPLKPVSAENIFPHPKESVVPENNKKADAEYKKLFDNFIDNLKILSHKDDIELWYEHFDSLMMIYTSHIPAARVGNIVYDISLYDHCRTTAALATSLYLFHSQTDTFTEKDIRSSKENKFLLINGDFKGIQNFIFSSSADSQKFRSKILRGRSFAVSLLSELAADMLCREIGLPVTSVILNAAGKFTIIAPNIPQTRASVGKIKKEINDWLVEISFGETIFNIAVIEASSSDFHKDKFIDLWDRFNLEMEQEKYSGFDRGSYGGAVDGYLDEFINEPGKPAVCPLCGKRPALDTFQEESVCKICRDHIFLGSNIVKKKRLSIYFINNSSKSENCLHEPVFGKYQISFSNDPGKYQNDLLKCWSLENEESTNSDVAIRFIKGYIPVYSEKDLADDRITVENNDQFIIGDPKTFNHIACMAKQPDPEKSGKYKGVESLGVLKADVDNLGLLMACGLKEKRFTLSRLATLSRQLNYYFTVYLPWFLEKSEFNNIYTVFAGGDDLFLIGPWNSIIEFAGSMQKSFADYVCQNKNITFSAGISIHKPHTTIDIMSESSEGSLDKAKSDGRDRLRLFSVTADWAEIQKLMKIEEIFTEWLEKGWISRVMFYNLNEFIKMAEKEKQLIEKDEIHINDMACTKWRSLLAYSVNRNIGKKNNDKEKIKQEVMVNLTRWLKTYEGKLRIPLWKILYNRRQEG